MWPVFFCNSAALVSVPQSRSSIGLAKPPSLKPSKPWAPGKPFLKVRGGLPEFLPLCLTVDPDWWFREAFFALHIITRSKRTAAANFSWRCDEVIYRSTVRDASLKRYSTSNNPRSKGVWCVFQILFVYSTDTVLPYRDVYRGGALRKHPTPS